MNYIEPELIAIPAGRHEFGQPVCPPNANIHWRWFTGHPVEVAAFHLAKYPVTNAEYRCYLADSDAPAPSHIDTLGFNGDRQPVVGLSWEDAQSYIRWLNGRTGKAYRLPTDAEFEYAARGGRIGTRFPWGDDLDPRYACFGGEAAPAPVGSYPLNGFGLADMVGNAWQWCEEKYEDVSRGITSRNTPTGKDPATNRVLRGGSFLTTHMLNLWIAYRHEDPADLRHECLGFRLAL